MGKGAFEIFEIFEMDGLDGLDGLDVDFGFVYAVRFLGSPDYRLDHQ